jgi:hypothetical protein
MVNWLSKKISGKTSKAFLELSHEDKVEKYLETILNTLIVIFVSVASIAIMLIPLLFR